MEFWDFITSLKVPMPRLIDLKVSFLVRALVTRDPYPLLSYGLHTTPSPETSPTRHPVRSSTCHLALSLGVNSHGALLTPPPTFPFPPSAMARPPHLPEALSRLSLGELDTPPPRLLLAQTSNWETMQSIRAAIAALSRTLVDIKFAVRNTYDAVCSNVNQNAEMASDINHVCTQLSCQDSRIDDLERNIFELMGKMDRLQEDMAVFTGATQGSWVHENPTVNQEINQVMVDASSAQLRRKG